MKEMKYLMLILLIVITSSCDNLRGWFPSPSDSPQISAKKPEYSCNRDIIIHFKNNCSKKLIMYFSELSPGSEINCENFVDHGLITPGSSGEVTIHAGKFGSFVFAEDAEGKCTGGHRKAEYTVTCNQVADNSNDTFLNICQ